MAQGIQELKEMLQQLLNPSIFTLDSAEGIIVTFLALVIVYQVSKHLGNFIGWCIGLLFLIQLGYVLGFTALNDYFPFSEIFKFDIITAVAQLFNGTPIATGLLYVSAFMQYIAKVLTETFVRLIPPFGRLLHTVFETMPWQPLSA